MRYELQVDSRAIDAFDGRNTLAFCEGAMGVYQRSTCTFDVYVLRVVCDGCQVTRSPQRSNGNVPTRNGNSSCEIRCVRVRLRRARAHACGMFISCLITRRFRHAHIRVVYVNILVERPRTRQEQRGGAAWVRLHRHVQTRRCTRVEGREVAVRRVMNSTGECGKTW